MYKSVDNSKVQRQNTMHDTKTNPQILGATQRSNTKPDEKDSPHKSISKPVVKIGIVVNDYANKTEELSSVQTQLGIHFSTVSLFKQFGLPTNNMISLDDLAYIKSQNSTVLIAWEPWNPEQGLQQSTDYLTEIADGKHDSYIKAFAQNIQQYGAPVSIRFAHEMNGDWYPWGNRPKEYVQAYRRIVTLFRNEGITNVSWMWSVNTTPLTTIDQFYPGDDYVDIIGIDGFNFGSAQPHTSWISFKNLFLPSYTYLSSHYSKPIIISETASAEEGGNKAKWIQDMFSDLPQSMPKIHELIWFNLLKEADWRLTSSHSSLSAFQAELK